MLKSFNIFLNIPTSIFPPLIIQTILEIFLASIFLDNKAATDTAPAPSVIILASFAKVNIADLISSSDKLIFESSTYLTLVKVLPLHST